MTLREISALASTIFVIIGTSRYHYLALTGNKVRPVLASWIVMAGTMTLSFATYWTSPHHSLVSNACNAISVVSTNSLMVLAVWFHLKQGKRVIFTNFQICCLWISFAIAILWIILVWGFGGTGIVPNILTQVLMVIGYIILVQKVWYSKTNSEPLFSWSCIVVASAFALCAAVISRDGLAILFAARSTVTSVILVIILHRIESRAQFEI